MREFERLPIASGNSRGSRESSAASFSRISSLTSFSRVSSPASTASYSNRFCPVGGEVSRTPPPILRRQTNWENLYFYQKTVVLYQLTYVFCRRFLPKYGDRTVDQMMTTHLENAAHEFTENGGIKERMMAARLGRRQTQNEQIAALQREVEGELPKEGFMQILHKPSPTG